jgi:hypothetical protein
MVRLSGPSGRAGRSSVRCPAELLLGVGFAVIIAATVVAAIMYGTPQRPAVNGSSPGGPLPGSGSALADSDDGTPGTLVPSWAVPAAVP